MKKRSVFPIILKSLALFCAIAAAGGFCKSFLMRECSNIAKELKKAENDLRALNRENDFWDAEIAKVHAPAFLRDAVRVILHDGLDQAGHIGEVIIERVAVDAAVLDDIPDGYSVQRLLVQQLQKRFHDGFTGKGRHCSFLLGGGGFR